MELSRRDFLKLSGGAVGGVALLGMLPTDKVYAFRDFPLEQWVQETTTICCYCSVGCGALVHTYDDGEIKIEGDPDHPINEGALCPKGQAMAQIRQVDGEINPYRLTKIYHREAGAPDWDGKDWTWDEAILEITKKIKETRNADWNSTTGRVDTIASLGGGELDNEECYLLTKMDRALGIAYLEHCARL